MPIAVVVGIAAVYGVLEAQFGVNAVPLPARKAQRGNGGVLFVLAPLAVADEAGRIIAAAAVHQQQVGIGGLAEHFVEPEADGVFAAGSCFFGISLADGVQIGEQPPAWTGSPFGAEAGFVLAVVIEIAAVLPAVMMAFGTTAQAGPPARGKGMRPFGIDAPGMVMGVPVAEVVFEIRQQGEVVADVGVVVAGIQGGGVVAVVGRD